MLANITALQNGGVRGIATGTSFRCVVSKTLARQFITVVEETCAPFHPLGLAQIVSCWERDVVETLGSSESPLLLPFVSAAYTEPTRYKWHEGHRCDIEQHEGGEQGDPMMPLLFSLAIHNALAAVKKSWKPERCCSRFWIGRAPSTTSWQRSSTFRQASSSMQARHARGTRVGRGHQMLTIWDQTCGMVRASRCWARQWVQTSSCSPMEEENRLWEAIGWPVRVAVTTFSGRCLPASQHCALQVKDHLGKTPRGCHTAERGRAHWDSVPPTGRLPQRIGLRGPMPCRCSPDVWRN